MKKLLCILLAGLMLLSVCACGNGTENTPTDTSAVTKSEESELETREPLDIPDTRYDGMELTFLTRDAGEWTTVDICPEDENHTDNISQAVYERNEIIRDKYGIVIKEIQSTDVPGAVARETSATSGDFQVAVSKIDDACNMVNNLYLTNLNAEGCENLDVTKPWWDGKLADNMTIEDRLYFATGDLLTSDNDGTFAILFNKSLATDCKLPDMYELVSSGKWTMDAMYQYELLAVNDKDGDGKLSYDSDVCGFAYTGDTPYCMLYAGGVTLISRDEDGSLVYSLDLERASNIADSVRLILSKDTTVDMNAAGGLIVEVGQKCFGENHCLFFGECLQCVTRVRGYDVDFGILPYPKYDEVQKEYCSLMEWVGCVVSIPRSVSVDQREMICSMLEAMAYYSVDTLTEQYYEINLKTKHSKDEQSGPMIDLILANRIYDLAYTFRWGGVVDSLAGTMRPGSSSSVASSSQRYQKSLENSVKQLLKKIENNKYE